LIHLPKFKVVIRRVMEHLRDWKSANEKPISSLSERREIPPKGTPLDGQNLRILE